MTFDMSSWNAKGCISRKWKHILSGRTFTWALVESPQAEQRGKLQASVWLEVKRIWFYHWACCVNMWACLYVPLYFLCRNLFSFLRCFLCPFWKMKTPVFLLHHALFESHRGFLCIGKISWDDRYMYSMFTLNLKQTQAVLWPGPLFLESHLPDYSGSSYRCPKCCMALQRKEPCTRHRLL